MSPFIAPLDRRTFLIDLGRVSVAYSVLGLAACAPAATTGPGGSASAAPSSSDDDASAPAGSPSAAASDDASNPPTAGVTWTRVNLGFVSAYVLARGGEAAVVDTGVSGSADDIETTLAAINLGWANVGHVILTHRHGDHVGSAADVLGLASDATGYAGAADIPAISVPRALVAVADNDDVFGLRIVATPGHTAGHVAVFDPAAGILVAGDALNNSTGTLAGSSPQNTENMADAAASVKKLAELTFETLLVGHGEPITEAADERVKELAATL